MVRSITIDDLYALKFVSRPRLSPDGQHIAYVVTSIDAQKHTYRSAIWLTAVRDGTPRRFTSGPANAHSPAWSPDGRWLAFVSEREGDDTNNLTSEQKKSSKKKPQIWIIPTDGGEARQLTFMTHGASNPVWSPDGHTILFTAATGPVDEETEDGKALPKARKIDHLWYRLDGVGFINERRTHLFLINAQGGEPHQLTDGDWDDREPAWSPDGSHIAFISDRSEDRWRWPGGDIYVLSTTQPQSSLRRVTDSSLACSSPSWSPNGQALALLASPKYRSAGQSYVYTISANSENTSPTNLTANSELSASDWTNSDIGDEHLAPAPIWSADGQSLFVLASHRGSSRIFVVPATTPGEATILTPGDIHVRDVWSDASRNTLALLIGDTTHPQEIFTCSTQAADTLHQVTHTNVDLLKDLILVKPEHITYAGADGWPIDGWILKPHNFDPSKQYPLVIEIHGGPHTQYGYGFFHEMQLLVAEGYVVFYCNPRGSIGYGYDFANAVRSAWGEKDSLDILAGMETLIKEGYIDQQRLAVIGGSYGGFMTNWLIGHDQRFRVAVTDRCVSNMASMFGASDIGWDLAVEHFETTPWEDLDKYMRMSPITYVQNMHTPLLILHSEQDLRCNMEQAEQLFAALKWLGRDVQFVRFEGQSHGLSRAGHPKLRQQRLHYIIDWFAKYLH